MELRQLRYFLAVVDDGSFTAAAARLYLTQPALSRQVADLERRLGCALLVRTPRGAAPTAAGELLAEHARDLLDRADEATRAVRRAALVGGLRLGMTADARSCVLASVQAWGPGGPEVVYGSTEVLVRLVDDGHLDAAVVWWSEPAGAQGVQHLLDEDLLAVLPATHELAELASVTAQQVAATTPVVLFEPGVARLTHDRLARMFRTGAVDAQILHSAAAGPDATEQESMVAAAGVVGAATIVTRRNWSTVIQAPGQVARPLAGASAPISLYYDERKAEQALALAEHVRAHAQIPAQKARAGAGMPIRHWSPAASGGTVDPPATGRP